MAILALDDLKTKMDGQHGVSHAATSLLNIIDDPEATRDEVSYLVSVDQGLCANAFKYANSAAMGSRREIESISEIVDYLGFNTLKQIATFVVAKSFVTDNELWFQSVFIANAAKRIAKLLNEETHVQDHSYTVALFLTYGRAILKNYYKSKFDQIMKLDDYFAQLDKEREIFNYNHHEVSATLLAQAGLPKSLISSISSQAERDSKGFTRVNAVIELAAALLHLEGKDEDAVKQAISQERVTKLVERFDFSELKVDKDFVDELFKEAKELVNI